MIGFYKQTSYNFSTENSVSSEVLMREQKTTQEMKWIRVRLDGEGGRAMEAEQLKSIYATDMEFEPDERRQRILEDGVVELAVSKFPYMVHAKISLPLYGNIWVMAHNEGKGYTEDFVDFVTEAIRSYLYDAHRYGDGVERSV